MSTSLFTQYRTKLSKKNLPINLHSTSKYLWALIKQGRNFNIVLNLNMTFFQPFKKYNNHPTLSYGTFSLHRQTSADVNLLPWLLSCVQKYSYCAKLLWKASVGRNLAAKCECGILQDNLTQFRELSLISLWKLVKRLLTNWLRELRAYMYLHT